MDRTVECNTEGNEGVPKNSQALDSEKTGENLAKNAVKNRAEIDTAPPFESVKEAVNMFGGSAVWKSHKIFDIEKQQNSEEAEVVKLEELIAQLEKDLIVKERETLDVLKELEITKKIIEELKLQSESSETIIIPDQSMGIMASVTDKEVYHIMHLNLITEPENQSLGNFESGQNLVDMSIGPAPSSPGSILMELKQAKVNLCRTTDDLTGIRVTVELLNRKIEKEKISLEKTRERLTLNSAKISSLEEELSQTKLILQLTKDSEISGSENPMHVSVELPHLSSEAEQFKKMAEAAKAEVLKTKADIEHMKTSIEIARIRWFAAKKMEEAARATEAVALAEIKAMRNSEKSEMYFSEKPSRITLSFEEYAALTSKAQEAEEFSNKRIEAAMLKIDEANVSKMRILKEEEEAKEEVKTSRKVLEEALNKAEFANREKLAVEEALRKWRSDHGQKRRSVHNSTKFKNSSSIYHRKNSAPVDVNGLSLVSDGSNSVLRPTLSIGQILSRKLFSPENFEMEMEEKSYDKPKVSLGQMLSRRHGVVSPQRLKKEGTAPNQFSAKRKKFGFPRFSLLLTEKKKNKKKKLAPRQC